MGSDRAEALDVAGRVVSIHAPTWGATRSIPIATPGEPSFNPRSHVGSDQGIHVASHLLKCFNPRSHVGSDQGRRKLRGPRQVSIHAPTWGATCSSHSNAYKRRVSIHAPTWGATHATKPPRFTLYRFNPRSHVGSDWPYVVAYRLLNRFQSTLPRGERRIK